MIVQQSANTKSSHASTFGWTEGKKGRRSLRQSAH